MSLEVGPASAAETAALHDVSRPQPIKVNQGVVREASQLVSIYEGKMMKPVAV